MVRKKYRLQTRRLIFAALLVIFVTVGFIAVINLVTASNIYAVSQKEYAELRQYAPPARVAAVSVSPSPVVEPAPLPVQLMESEPTPDLAEINPDYIGWIRIEGTEIDYPVVQGADNKKYLNTTFSGGRNASGTIYMDSRCANGFDSYAIVYGLNMKDGSMFAGLNRYLESGYLDEHPEIMIITPDGETHIYGIFDVKVTGTGDAAYKLPDKGKEVIAEHFAAQNIQEDASILVLSTCTKSNDDNERLLIFAERR